MQERVVRQIRTLRAVWRGLETESQNDLNGHDGGNADTARKILRIYGASARPTDMDLAATGRALDITKKFEPSPALGEGLSEAPCRHSATITGAGQLNGLVSKNCPVEPRHMKPAVHR